MNRIGVFKSLSFLSLIFIFGLQGCGILGIGGGGGGFNDNGELIGAQGREGWEMTRPFGMVAIPPGTFHMGQADQDVPATQINFNKQVTIGPFYMDDTEITNNEYRQFTEDITEGSESDLPEGFVVEDLVPDSTVWVRDFTHHMGDPLWCIIGLTLHLTTIPW